MDKEERRRLLKKRGIGKVYYTQLLIGDIWNAIEAVDTLVPSLTDRREETWARHTKDYLEISLRYALSIYFGERVEEEQLADAFKKYYSPQ